MACFLLINRVVIGAFSAISGLCRLFLKSRHASLVQTLKDDAIPAVGFFLWFVALVEFFAGNALLIGLLAPLAVLGILARMTAENPTEGTKQAKGFATVDKADTLDNVVCLSETTNWFMALFVILGGPGRYTLHVVFRP